MASVQSLRIDWCKMDKFTSKDKMTGGWVAESYLAYARLLPFWYNGIVKMCASMDTMTMQCLISSTFVCVCSLMTKTAICWNTVPVLSLHSTVPILHVISLYLYTRSSTEIIHIAQL